MCVIITQYSIDPLMEILFSLTIVYRQVRLLGQLEVYILKVGRDSVFWFKGTSAA